MEISILDVFNPFNFLCYKCYYLWINFFFRVNKSQSILDSPHQRFQYCGRTISLSLKMQRQCKASLRKKENSYKRYRLVPNVTCSLPRTLFSFIVTHTERSSRRRVVHFYSQGWETEELKVLAWLRFDHCRESQHLVLVIKLTLFFFSKNKKKSLGPGRWLIH